VEQDIYNYSAQICSCRSECQHLCGL